MAIIKLNNQSISAVSALPAAITTGKWEFVNSASTTTNVAALELSLSTNYVAHHIYLESIAPATDNVYLRCRLSTDGGSTFQSGAGDYSTGGINTYNEGTSNGISANWDSRASSLIRIGDSVGGGTVNEGLSLNIFVYPRQSNSNGHHGNTVHWSGYRYDTSTTYRGLQGIGHLYNSSDLTVDAIQFLFSSGDVTYSSYYQYGIKGS